MFSWGSSRVPFAAFLLTSANNPARAYKIAAKAILADTDMEDPTYHLEFVCGRAALAQLHLDQAGLHFERFHQRFPGAALARYALGDLLLWQDSELDRAHQLLSSALADSDRMSLPHWERLGFEAELYASYTWSLAAIDKADGFQYSFDKAIELAGDNRPVRAAVHLRLGFALRAMHKHRTARQHWQYACDVDPEGWSGNQAQRELRGDD